MTPPDDPAPPVARAERHRAWVQASADIATALLSGADPSDVEHLVCARVADLTGADVVAIATPTPGDQHTLTIVAAVGRGAAAVEGVRLPLHGTHSGYTYRSGLAQLIDDVSTGTDEARAEVVDDLARGFASAILAPLGSRPSRGTIVAMRATGRDPYDEEARDLFAVFATSAAAAFELARGQRREQRLLVQADRDRIARDLHDGVVQRLFATALALERIGRGLAAEHPVDAERISRGVDDLHDTIGDIRAAIFALHAVGDGSGDSVRGKLAAVLHQVTDGHSLRPDLRADERADDLPAEVVSDLVAVVRELVTNVLRHARATRVTVEVSVADEVQVTVSDDGCGVPDIIVRSGLANLADRAHRRGGRLGIRSSATGSAVSWAVPLPTVPLSATVRPAP